jgi:hypothetical protein
MCLVVSFDVVDVFDWSKMSESVSVSVFLFFPLFHARTMMGLFLPNDALAIGIGAFFGAMSRHQVGIVAAEWIAKDTVRVDSL